MTLLIIDDEVQIRTLMGVLLRKHGHEVLSAGSEDEAQRIWEQGHERIEVIVCDLNLGTGSGMELCQRFKADKPGVRVILCSGWIEEGSGFETIQKPFAPADLVTAVESRA